MKDEELPDEELSLEKLLEDELPELDEDEDVVGSGVGADAVWDVLLPQAAMEKVSSASKMIARIRFMILSLSCIYIIVS